MAIGDVDHVSAQPEVGDVLGEDQLHLPRYGSSAISRADFTATATLRWHCGQLPVTRRSGSRPGPTNRRNSARSL